MFFKVQDRPDLMRRLLFVATLVLAWPAFGQVDPKIHKLCVQAKDYAGCVNANAGTGEPKNIVINQAAPVADGNSCPGDTRYSGGGTCTTWVCESSRWAGRGHEPQLAGKDSGCMAGGEMRWGNETTKSIVDPSCPVSGLAIGWKSTCNMVLYYAYTPPTAPAWSPNSIEMPKW